jgi:hypothetical protein
MYICLKTSVGMSVVVWLRSLTSIYLPLKAVGLNYDRKFGLYHVWKLSSLAYGIASGSTHVPICALNNAWKGT